MKMKAAVTLLLHLGVLLCLCSVQVHSRGFLWDPPPTTAPTRAPGEPAGERAPPITVPAQSSIADLWSQLIGRLETRTAALQTDVLNLDAKNTALERDLAMVRAESAEARRVMMESGNVGLTGLQNNLNRVWSWLRTDRDSRSAFSVALTNNETWMCVGPYDELMTVHYRAVLLNVGGDYDESSGVFTVRLPGVYVLALTVYSNTGAPFQNLHLCATLTVNGVMVVNPSEKYRQDQEDSTSAVVSLHLTVGDKVAVHLPAGCKLCDDNGHHNTFTAFLLYSTGAPFST